MGGCRYFFSRNGTIGLGAGRCTRPGKRAAYLGCPFLLRLRARLMPPLRPAARASSVVHSWPCPLWCEALPPAEAMRCRASGVRAAKPRGLRFCGWAPSPEDSGELAGFFIGLRKLRMGKRRPPAEVAATQSQSIKKREAIANQLRRMMPRRAALPGEKRCLYSKAKY